MAEADTAAEKSGSAFGFLGHKIAGKVPVWVLAAAAVGGYYWYTRYGPGKKTATAAQTTGTDPAGNTGIIDPATGYVYGSSEDLAALAAAGNTGQDNSGYGGGGGTAAGPPPGTTGQPGIIPMGPGEGGPPPKKPVITSAHITGDINSKVPIGEGRIPVGKTRTAPSKTTPRRSAPSFLPAASGNSNQAWGGSAVSNLISQGVPPDQASAAIQAHLNGQPLSPGMAASRDLAIDSIGPPPQVPAPAQVRAPMTAGSKSA